MTLGQYISRLKSIESQYGSDVNIAEVVERIIPTDTKTGKELSVHLSIQEIVDMDYGYYKENFLRLSHYVSHRLINTNEARI